MSTITENMTSKEIETAVDQLLLNLSVKVSLALIGERVEGDWKHDLWFVAFKRGSKVVDFEYRTGIGHRKQTKPMPQPPLRKGTIAYETWVKDAFSPVAPKAASVLYSLILDSSARDQCFDDWCSEFGYDSDSIKALNIYNACCENGKKLLRVFSHTEIEQFAELTSNY